MVLIKKCYNKTSTFDALTGIWQSYTVAIIALTLYLVLYNKKSWTEITTKCNWNSSKWFVLAGLLSAVSTIFYMPLLKSLDYSKLSLIKNPLGMALTIAISILFLGESLDRKAIIGFFMYLSIPFILTVF